VTLSTADRQAIVNQDEATLLGLIMFPDLVEVFDDVLRLVKPGDFLSPARGLIWHIASTFRHNGTPIDVAAVHAALAADGTGISTRLALDIITRECTTAPVAEHALLAASRVAGAARSRKLAQHGQRLAQLAEQGGLDDPQHAAKLRELLRDIEATHDSGTPDLVVEVADYGPEYLAGLTEGPPAEVIPTPWASINEKFSGGGLRPGGFYVFGARPGDGKTLAGGALAMTAAESGYSGLFFSAEMTRREIMDRWIARALREELSEFTSFAPSQRVLRSAADHVEWMRSAGLRLGIVDASDISVPLIASTARTRKRTIGLDFIVVDYVQLLTSSGGRNRQEEVAEMSSGLKRLAKELEIPVVALAQLNRSGADGVPRKEHLRETGRLEQDADGIILLHRPTAETTTGEQVPTGDVEFILAKNRHGTTGTVTLRWRAHWGDITDVD
jgi:replicative DNA helicase